jgi:hypothetical protein
MSKMSNKLWWLKWQALQHSGAVNQRRFNATSPMSNALLKYRPRSAASDMRRNNKKVPKHFATWVKNPRRYDWPGLDKGLRSPNSIRLTKARKALHGKADRELFDKVRTGQVIPGGGGGLADNIANAIKDILIGSRSGAGDQGQAGIDKFQTWDQSFYGHKKVPEGESGRPTQPGDYVYYGAMKGIYNQLLQPGGVGGETAKKAAIKAEKDAIRAQARAAKAAGNTAQMAWFAQRMQQLNKSGPRGQGPMSGVEFVGNQPPPPPPPGAGALMSGIQSLPPMFPSDPYGNMMSGVEALGTPIGVQFGGGPPPPPPGAGAVLGTAMSVGYPADLPPVMFAPAPFGTPPVQGAPPPVIYARSKPRAKAKRRVRTTERFPTREETTARMSGAHYSTTSSSSARSTKKMGPVRSRSRTKSTVLVGPPSRSRTESTTVLQSPPRVVIESSGSKRVYPARRIPLTRRKKTRAKRSPSTTVISMGRSGEY